MDNDQIKNILDNLISGICAFSYDTQGNLLTFEYINDGGFRMLGTTRAAGEKYITQHVREMILPQDMPIVSQWLTDVLEDNGDVETIFRYITFQGGLAHMRIKGNLYDRHGSLHKIVCTFSDCSEEISIKHEMEKELNLMNSLVSFQTRFDYQVRTDSIAFHKNDAVHEEDEVLVPHYLSSHMTYGIHPDDQPLFLETMERVMKRPCKDQIEYKARELDESGDYRWYQCNFMSIAGNEGYVTHVLGLIVDIHDRKMEELKLQTKADTDSLTQLLNKGATEASIRSEISSHHTDKHMDALMIIDVDDFKYINDHFGHLIGDQVLHFVGDALKQNLKGMDVAGRIGGDEFMVFLQNIKSIRDAEIVATHLQDVIHGNFESKEVADHLSVSIGIAIGQDDTEDYEEMFKEADDALYETKHHGKAGFTISPPSHSELTDSN